MGVSVLMVLIGVIFAYAGMSLGQLAAGFPLFARIMTSYPSVALGLQVASFVIMATAFWQGWRHQARCLIDCYPKYFDIYNE